MSMIAEVCPKCGAKFKEKSNTWMYGCPIKQCKSCQSEFVDTRWREVAIQGLDQKSGNTSLYVKSAIISFFVALIDGWIIYNSSSIWTTEIAVGICAIIGFVMSIIMIFRIELGFEKKSNQRYLDESKRRMADPEYVRKLSDFGYYIPDEYRE